MSLLYDHKTNTNDCHVLLDDNNSVDDVSDSILLRIPLLIFTSCLTNSIIRFMLKSMIEIIFCSIPKQQQQEDGTFNNKWRPSLQSITEEEEEEDEDLIFRQEPEKEEKKESSQIMKATSQKENDMLTAAAAAVFSFSSASSSNNKALLSSSSSIAVPIHTILSNRFTLLRLQSRSLLRFNQAFLLLNCCSKFEISTFDIELN
ncbi:hypothetical protein FRACYDRAFT_246359 [Fragilariopsis cylindrus CCMP1102]|uniref:Uncharacterized protein n=1 Tax=Fragilariopsis cylindrus CCMP1102 TaxID=635003 RepID=A0A1E7EZG7_9STRA|nr:hypothetical protein FRACYDRAFT_246359 [Fragilariopsis cylindrus CCMP1102]|eukprot:OEU11246.1 hypothetical protein FRACYDRAFT_246359 [Fragilariopsis cylindrus CCMP1102]